MRLRSQTSRASQRSQAPTDLPPNTFLKTQRGYFYLSKGKRYRIITNRVLNSWSPPRIVNVNEEQVSHYPVWSKLKFRNGSLIHNFADGKIYLIADGKRCHVTSPDVLDRIGATRKDVIDVSLAEINLHAEGEPLT